MEKNKYKILGLSWKKNILKSDLFIITTKFFTCPSGLPYFFNFFFFPEWEESDFHRHKITERSPLPLDPPAVQSKY